MPFRCWLLQSQSDFKYFRGYSMMFQFFSSKITTTSLWYKVSSYVKCEVLAGVYLKNLNSPIWQFVNELIFMIQSSERSVRMPLQRADQQGCARWTCNLQVHGNWNRAMWRKYFPNQLSWFWDFNLIWCGKLKIYHGKILLQLTWNTGFYNESTRAWHES